MVGRFGNFSIPLAQTSAAHLFIFLNSDRYRLRILTIQVTFGMYMVMLGNYTFLGLAVWQRKQSVSYITFHSRDRMTWDGKEPYYLGDLHLLNNYIFARSFLKVEFMVFDLPPFFILAIGPFFFFIYWLLALLFLLLAIGSPVFFIGYWPGVALLLPIGSTWGPHRKHSKV